MGQAGMKNNWKRNTRYMGVFAVLAAVFCMIVVLNINTGNVQISVPEILGGALALSGFLLQTFFPTRSQDRMYWGFLRVQR